MFDMNGADEKLMRVAELETLRCLQAAERTAKFQLPAVTIDFLLRGATAGKVRLSPYSSPAISYNSVLLNENQLPFLSQTIPHEVAHIAIWYLYQNRVRPHGLEWKQMVVELGGTAKRCHTFTIRSKQQRHYQYIQYRCACQNHQLTLIRHNRILKGNHYYCKRCKAPLKLLQSN
jgi:SprT protein